MPAAYVVGTGLAPIGANGNSRRDGATNDRKGREGGKLHRRKLRGTVCGVAQAYGETA